jgi:hypothetical protein
VRICGETGTTLDAYARNKLALARARGERDGAGLARKSQIVRASRRGAGGELVTLAMTLPGRELPSSFRIFAAGRNATTKGVYVFDSQSAREVMAAYAQHGADIPIDLEHLSIADPDRSVNFDPDARGWAKLELRHGELWAVDVKWTPDGEARLRQKRQRYISPAFACDANQRITELINIAITSMPATHNLSPLIAASR